MIKIFEDDTLGGLEGQINDWLIHSGVKIVSWQWNCTEKPKAYVLVLEYTWLDHGVVHD